MTILLSRIVPRNQLVAVHAPLGEVEWPGTIEHIRATLPARVPLILAPIASGKTLLDRVEERGKWPDPARRWCTGDYKRTPIERELRSYLKAHPRFGGRIVSAMGMRAEESAVRARKSPWRLNDRSSRAGRTRFDWLPIFDLTERQVFRVIRQAGQTPHPFCVIPVQHQQSGRRHCVYRHAAHDRALAQHPAPTAMVAQSFRQAYSCFDEPLGSRMQVTRP